MTIQRERARITIDIDLDPVPGSCDSVDYWVQHFKYQMEQGCPWYNPTVQGELIREAPALHDQFAQLAEELIRDDDEASS